MKHMKRRILSIMMALVLCVGLYPTWALAEESASGACTHYTEHTPDRGYRSVSANGDGSRRTDECSICSVQELIAALPDPGSVTADNAEGAAAQIGVIDEAIEALAGDEPAAVDFTRYEAVRSALEGLMDGSPALIAAESGVSYRTCDADGQNWRTETCGSATAVDSATTGWGAGWYVVDGDVTVSGVITVTGEVHLILTDGCVLTAPQGINVGAGNSLTVYAQSEGADQGLLSATGGRLQAGIGGGQHKGSGAVTINGGSVAATGGLYSAGIGGSSSGAVGPITINGGCVTAVGCSEETKSGSAGIGGGYECPEGYVITITGGSVTAAGGSRGGAGIGGGSNGSGGHIAITGGSVTANGGSRGAGIGGGTYGNGGEIAISGGTIVAQNGGDSSKAIGNGYSGKDGTTDRQGGLIIELNNNDKKGQLYSDTTLDHDLTIAEGVTVTIPEGKTLTVAEGVSLTNNGGLANNGSLANNGTLVNNGTVSGDGMFTTEILTEDMIAVPKGLYFTGQDRSDDLKNLLSAELDGGIIIGGQTYTVSGWTVDVSTTDNFTYTATFENAGSSKSFLKDITLQKSAATLEGHVQTYKDGTATGSFTADDTITVIATPTATGAAPTKAAARLREGYAEPAAGQMALLLGNVLACEPVNANPDGSYTMTVEASDVLVQYGTGVNGAPIPLKAAFWENDKLAYAEQPVEIRISAVAEIKKDDQIIGYAGDLSNVFTGTNSGAVITLLDHVTAENQIRIDSGSFTLDLSDKTLMFTGSDAYLNLCGSDVTIKGSGSLLSQNNHGVRVQEGSVLTVEGGTIRTTGRGYSAISQDGGTVTIRGGSFESNGSGYAALSVGGGTASVSDGIFNGGADNSGSGKLQLSGGTFIGKGTLGGDPSPAVGAYASNLKDTLASGYAYYNAGGEPVTSGLDEKELSDTVTVRECGHTGDGVCEYSHTSGATTHLQTCLACGRKWEEANCGFDENGSCVCGAGLAAALDNAELTYSGEAQTPEVRVTVDGTALTGGYTVSYDDNINAGNTAKATMTGTAFTGTFTLPFTIKPATPTLAWESNTQELTYTGKEAMITAPMATGPNDIRLDISHDTGPCQFSYAAQDSGEFTDGLPIGAGTYTIKAHVEAKGNYAAADSANTLTLTINKAQGTLTVPETQVGREFGDAPFLLNCSTNGDGRISYESSKEDVASVSAEGTVLINAAGTAVITVSLAEGVNYSAAGSRNVTVSVDKKGGYMVEPLNRSYLYSRANADSVDLAALLPGDCGAAAYGTPEVSGDVTYSTAPAVTDGKLSYTQGIGNINDEGSITVTVTTRNYEDIIITIEVRLTDQIPVGLKEGTEVTLTGSVLTFGESLSKLGFNSAVFVDGDGNTVEGTLAWKDAAATPDAGTTSAVWVFTPTDQMYASAEGTAAITVNRAVPAVSAAPTVAGRVYNPSRVLEKSDLSGGAQWAAWTERDWRANGAGRGQTLSRSWITADMWQSLPRLTQRIMRPSPGPSR